MDDERQASPPAGDGFIALSSGWKHTCALREDGTAVCWGGSVGDTSAELLGEQRFIAISSGWFGFCALRADGSLLCSSSRSYSGQPPEGETFKAISLGDSHGCGLRQDGSPVCWEAGYSWSSHGQAAPPLDERFVAISSGYDHTCALRADGTPICWGAADPRVDRGQASPPPGERFVALSSGSDFTCGLHADGTHVCWRFNPSSRSIDAEVRIHGGRSISFVSGGDLHSCGRLEDGSSGCLHTSPGRQVPESISGRGFEAVSDRVLTSISNGNRFTCALDPDGAPLCWGIDDYGQASPPAGERFVALSSGERHVCALRPDGAPICWGDPAQGRTAPPASETFVAISSGWAHTCALRTDGTPVCWGRNDYGQALPPDGEQFIAIRQRACAHLRPASGWKPRLLGQERQGAGVAAGRCAVHCD